MAVFALLINGVNVLPGSGLVGGSSPAIGKGSLVSFERTYDGPAELVFRVLTGDWTRRPFGGDTEAVLTRNGVVVFLGVLDQPRPIASERDFPAVEYTAHDHGWQMQFPPAVDAADMPSIILSPGTLSAVVNEYLTYVGETLTAKGMSATVDFLGGADGIETFPVSLDNQTIDAGFRAIAAAAPGVRCLVLPDVETGENRYTFVNIYGTDTRTIVIDETRVPELTILQSVEGKAGAVRTLARQTTGVAQIEYDTSEPLTPVWDSAYEQDWTWSEMHTVDSTGAPSPLAGIFRVFSYATNAIDELTPMRALVAVVPDPSQDPDDALYQWVDIVWHDVAAKTVWLKKPAITALFSSKVGRLHPFEPGRAKPAFVSLRYSVPGSVMIPIYIEATRVPAAGYAGRVMDLAPATCAFAQIITVPGGVNAESYAHAAHLAMSEPTVTGSIPLNDDLPVDLWRLANRISLTTSSHGLTGYEGLEAPLIGVRVDFERGGSATLAFNKDASERLAEGAR